jgi:hypothetical protein
MINARLADVTQVDVAAREKTLLLSKTNLIATIRF